MLPILVSSIRRELHPISYLRGYLESARHEILEKEQKFLETRTRYFLQLRSQRERREVSPCFEAEERAFTFARLALESLDGYLKTSQRGYLDEVAHNFDAAENQFQQLLKFRKRLGPFSQEDLQRAA